MNSLRSRMVEEMELRRMSERTQEAYVHWVVELSKWSGKSPDRVTSEEVRSYFLYLTNERQLSSSSVKQAVCGLKFFNEKVLKREWSIYDIAWPRKEKKVPVVLSREEVVAVLTCVHNEAYRVCLSTLYGCGLRLNEGLHLEVGDIDGRRKLVHVRRGKGGRERYVPMSEQTLGMLRRFWVGHRHPRLLFPARPRAGESWEKVSKPLHKSNVQRAIKGAVEKSGIGKRATCHTLRHSWATHLLESGVNMRLLQKWLGHRSLTTTSRYMHCTREAETVAAEAIERLSEILPSASERGEGW